MFTSYETSILVLLRQSWMQQQLAVMRTKQVGSLNSRATLGKGAKEVKKCLKRERLTLQKYDVNHKLSVKSELSLN